MIPRRTSSGLGVGMWKFDILVFLYVAASGAVYAPIRPVRPLRNAHGRSSIWPIGRFLAYEPYFCHVRHASYTVHEVDRNLTWRAIKRARRRPHGRMAARRM